MPREEAQQLRFPLGRALVNRQVIRQREPIIIRDIRCDTPLARMFRQTAGAELESTFDYVRFWLGVPLMAKGEMLGHAGSMWAKSRSRARLARRQTTNGNKAPSSCW